MMVRAICCLFVVIVCVFWKTQGDDACESYNLASVVALVIQVKTEFASKQEKMQNTITSQAVKIKEIERTVTSQTNKIQHLESTIEALEKKNQAVPAAGFSVNKIKEVSSGVMTFTNVVINTDQAYNLTTGTFTCPTPGHYYFFFSLNKKSSFTNMAYCDIRKNGDTLVFGITESDVYLSVVTSVYVHLSAGDTVTLEHCKESAWSLGQKSSLFSGFLVTPDA